jgi:hypothetical protein
MSTILLVGAAMSLCYYKEELCKMDNRQVG